MIFRFLFVVAVSVSFDSCVNDPETVKSMTGMQQLPMQTARDVDLLYSDSAKLKIHLKAPRVDEFGGSKPYTVMPIGVKVEFFDSEGKIDSYLSADHAVRRDREQTMEARGNVELLSVEGKKLNTDHLNWDGTSRRIFTDAFVTITTADQVIMGTGLEADDMLENYTIKNITGSFLLNE
ncbi:MAG TPA: LPS export ABC transporter periplasmic protein LptC [Bacteroidia bacterium]|nr:LPS export ABC transporter periplasmic protein LptC [Bacteroidia bacterium]